MCFRRLTVPLLAVSALSCAEPPTQSLEPSRLTPVDAPLAHEFGPEDTPTQQEYEAAGSPGASFESNTPSGSFNGDHTTYSVAASVWYNYVNDVRVSLTGRVIDNTGNELNSNTDTREEMAYRFIVSTKTQPMAASVSTLNHKCDVSGKGRLQGSAYLKIIINPTTFSTIWSKTIDKAAGDVDAPECPRRTEQQEGLGESGEPCTDAEYCPAPDGWGSSAGAPPGAAGGNSVGCILWWIRGLKSEDDGQTWNEEWIYYWWQCP